MSKFNLAKANEALKRTAEIAKNGTAQQRSGRFLIKRDAKTGTFVKNGSQKTEHITPLIPKR